MADEKRWVVTPSKDQSLTDVHKKLVEGGFKVDQVLHETGLITGVADDDVVEKVRQSAKGVDISPEVPVDIGPDSPETW